MRIYVIREAAGGRASGKMTASITAAGRHFDMDFEDNTFTCAALLVIRQPRCLRLTRPSPYIFDSRLYIPLPCCTSAAQRRSDDTYEPQTATTFWYPRTTAPFAGGLSTTGGHCFPTRTILASERFL